MDSGRIRVAPGVLEVSNRFARTLVAEFHLYLGINGALGILVFPPSDNGTRRTIFRLGAGNVRLRPKVEIGADSAASAAKEETEKSADAQKDQEHRAARFGCRGRHVSSQSFVYSRRKVRPFDKAVVIGSQKTCGIFCPVGPDSPSGDIGDKIRAHRNPVFHSLVGGLRDSSREFAEMARSGRTLRAIFFTECALVCPRRTRRERRGPSGS